MSFSFKSLDPMGTMFTFNPPTGWDSMIRSGVKRIVSTRHQCITAMEVYEEKSLEELRLEDYRIAAARRVHVGRWENQRNEDSVDPLRCIICVDKDRDTVFQPCGHLITCSSCAENFQFTCPMCRNSITEKIKAYIN